MAGSPQSPEFYVNQALQAGVPESFITEFIAANTNAQGVADYNRILEAYASEPTADVQRLAAVALPSQFTTPVVQRETGVVIANAPRSLPRDTSPRGEPGLAPVDSFTLAELAGRSDASFAAKRVGGRARQAGTSSRAVSTRARLLASARKRGSRPAATNPAAITAGLTTSTPRQALRKQILAAYGSRRY